MYTACNFALLGYQTVQALRRALGRVCVQLAKTKLPALGDTAGLGLHLPGGARAAAEQDLSTNPQSHAAGVQLLVSFRPPGEIARHSLSSFED